MDPHHSTGQAGMAEDHEAVVMLTVVTGPPCSGKTTYVRQYALPGDVIIDLDAIAQALGSPVTHDHEPGIRKVALEARAAAIKMAISRHQHHGARAWIIESAPDQARRSWYASRDARFVDLSESPDELHRRAAESGRPVSAHSQIDSFLARADHELQQRTAW